MKGFIKKNKLLVIVGLIYAVLMVVSRDKALASLKNTSYYVIEMFQIMPVIFLLTSLIEAWVPKEVIMKGFGESSGIKGTFFSFLLGSFSAGPIYAAFPISKMLLRKGASISNIVIILSAWAVIKVPMLANEAKFLGVRFMGTRWILTTIAILLMSYLVAFIVKKEDIPSMEEETTNTNLNVKEEYCVGCGVCVRLYPKEFKLVDGKAKYINLDKSADLGDVISKCPVRAISAG